MKLTRRDTLTLAAMATAAGLAGMPSLAFAAEGDMIDLLKLMAPAGIPDKVLGSPDAKVTVIEYASPTCPHCASFHSNVYPQLKTEYIDTNKIQFVPRPFMRNVLDAVVFMLAEAAGLHPTYISDIERGARNPSWKALVQLCAGLGVPTSALAAAYDVDLDPDG